MIFLCQGNISPLFVSVLAMLIKKSLPMKQQMKTIPEKAKKFHQIYLPEVGQVIPL